MQREPNVNGGTKLLTASVVMTLGVGGALLFRQEPTDSPRPDAAAGESLVRRSLGPAPIGATPAAIGPNAVGQLGGAQFTGAIDPFRNPGTQADTERRLTSDYGRLPPTSVEQPAIVIAERSGDASYGVGPSSIGSSSPFPPSRYFVDPKSEAERTPMNNVTANPRLPAEYPAAGGGAATTSFAAPSGSNPAGPLVPLGSLGSPAGGGASNVGERNRSSFVNSAGDLGASSVGSGFGAGGFGDGRAVMPTLRANSGGDPFAGASASVGGAAGPVPANAAPFDGGRDSHRSQSGGGRAKRHRVRDGDTLTGLSQKYYGDAERYIAIYEANRALLANPDLLPIGADLVIPSAEEAAATTASIPAAATPPAARLLPRVQIRPLGE